MDLLRNAITAFIHSFPIETIGECVVHNNDPFIESYIEECVSEILKWEDHSHTKSEMQLLVNAITNDWCVSDDMHITKERYSLLKRFPLLLNEFSNKVLIIHGNQSPMVRFNDLLRWRYLSIKIGEDILVACNIAYRDFQEKTTRTRFLWPTVLTHDNIRINAILDEELSDTHAHINASTDVFEFNWLRLMNYPSSLIPSDLNDRKKFNRSCWQDGMRKNYDIVKPHLSGNRMNHSLMEWSVVAAAIRQKLFCLLNGLECDTDRNTITTMYDGVEFNYECIETLKNNVAVLREAALSTSNGIVIDYAIVKEDFKDGVPTSPLMVNHGERYLLYKWFYAYFSNAIGVRDNADLMLLYLVIKAKIRREFIQTNALTGFGNFQDYDGVKFQFIPPKAKDPKFWNLYRENIYRYAVQTSLGQGKNVHLEARITPWEIDSFKNWDYTQSIFAKETVLKEKQFNPITFVVHFIKEFDSEPTNGLKVRHWNTRKTLINCSKLILKAISEKNDNYPKIVGIDAAGSELNCRPEVFAPYFRYLRTKNIVNFTFHAGEDFYDLIDGMRTIDEAINYMDYRFGDRIGHGIALGTDVFKYYDERHNYLVIPAQILLDNLIWLKYKAASSNIQLSAKTILFIEQQFRTLTCKLCYTEVQSAPIDSFDYYRSMSMRGDMCALNPNEDLTIFSDSVKWSPISCAKDNNDNIRKLYNHYEFNAKCRIEGQKVITLKLPSSFSKDISAIQEKILDDLERKGIVIETNPTSNMKIGRFSRYDQHPIVRFHAIDKDENRHSIMISINTDDKGLFGTSLRNEYSLIALALRKTRNDKGELKWSDAQIENYLRKIAHYGNISRFEDVYY